MAVASAANITIQ